MTPVSALIRFSVRWSLRWLAFLIAVAMGIAVFKDSLLRQWLRYRIEAVTGLETQLAAASLRLREGSLTLTDFHVRNSPEFGGTPLLVAPELHIELDSDALRRRELRFRIARLNIAEFTVVRDAKGRTNLFVIRDTAERNASLLDLALAAPAGFEFTGIERLVVTLGTLHLVDLVPPGFHRPIPIAVTNEVLRDVRTTADLNPLILQVILREIRAGIAEGLRREPPSTGTPPTSQTPLTPPRSLPPPRSPRTR